MVTLTKGDSVKTLSNEELIAKLVADGWVVADEAEKQAKPKAKKGKGEE